MKAPDFQWGPRTWISDFNKFFYQLCLSILNKKIQNFSILKQYFNQQTQNLRILKQYFKWTNPKF